MTDPRRRFNSRERVALWLAADGKCESCGVELTAGWHADHVIPHSKGGPTDSYNGAALCAQCNLKKGNKMLPPLRKWQQKAITAMNNLAGKDVTIGACPGAGKSTVAFAAMRQHYDDKKADFFIVVVPSVSLTKQFQAGAAKWGLKLVIADNSQGAAVPPDHHGLVTTYASVASQPDLYRRHCDRRQVLVVLDEVHHAGGDAHPSWGPRTAQAFELAYRRLLMTGTPWRSDSSQIPFARYDDDGMVCLDYSYDFGAAWAEVVGIV